MSHMVIFQTPEGNPGYNQFETVAEAVAFVEKLRNEQLVENARIFALEELKFDFRPYYRVELTALERAAGQTNGAPVAAAAMAPPAAAPAPAPAPAPPAPAPQPAPTTATAPPPPAPTQAPVAPAPAPIAAATATVPGDENAPVGAAPFAAAGGDAERKRGGLFGR
ncbi:MAG TPA: hypothetical protein PKD80_06255 [Microthrixaceae bacterium]|nr:hypothetical protein [Microthrixaceae bacterium]HMT24518.1 hypothetical protein [Microthrixaceae bacterium]HMT60389.1 hypothetical protein [Microthrixaceae bacterium]